MKIGVKELKDEMIKKQYNNKTIWLLNFDL